MPAHLMAEADFQAQRPRLAGANYRGTHRAASFEQLPQPGALVLEPESRDLSSVIRLVDARTALVRHIGSFDDHPIALTLLRPASAA